MKFAKKQNGVALMVVLLIFALVSILAAGMIDRQSLFIQKTKNILVQSQGYEFALGAEVFARQVLNKDWESDKEDGKFIDSPDEEWYQKGVSFPLDNGLGLIEVEAEDLQSRLNINDLVDFNGEINAATKERFDRLVKDLGLTTITTEIFKDWVDDDQNVTGADGAEDNEYQVQDPPYRTGQQLLNAETELLLIQQSSDEKDLIYKEFKKLLPYIAVLPVGYGGINVNTAKREVLQVLTDPELSDKELDALIEYRKETPFEKTADFLARQEIQGKKITNTFLSVNSEFFRVLSKVSYDDKVIRLESVLYRNAKDGKLTLLRRDQGRRFKLSEAEE